jgi:hypothetical protein
MLRPMSEEPRRDSALKGRLADVYVPALVSGQLEALSKRLGNRATIDDPLHGRASSLGSIDPLLAKTADLFAQRQASYRHVGSTTGVDRDTSEGMLTTPSGDIPVLVVAERRRLREIELRLYYTADDGSSHRKTRPPLFVAGGRAPLPQLVAHVVEALRRGAVERVLAAFEEGSRFVDAAGRMHGKKDGKMNAFLARIGGRLDVVTGGTADDGRTCCVEIGVTRPERDAEAGAMVFERGDSGLLRELRLYFEA